MSDEELLAHLRNSKGWPTLGKAAADRIEALTAKLAKAVEFAEIVEKCGHGALWDLSRTTLAEIKGESHETLPDL